jgi:hypothetical protein
MDTQDILRELETLSREQQQEVEDFITFLASRGRRVSVPRRKPRGKLSDEPFCGMWKDREDMKDSTAGCGNCEDMNGAARYNADRSHRYGCSH